MQTSNCLRTPGAQAAIFYGDGINVGGGSTNQQALQAAAEENGVCNPCLTYAHFLRFSVLFPRGKKKEWASCSI